jgi:hypothetical protein
MKGSAAFSKEKKQKDFFEFGSWAPEHSGSEFIKIASSGQNKSSRLRINSFSSPINLS